jgi:putative addiction module component (TIGR02574 family)
MMRLHGLGAPSGVGYTAPMEHPFDEMTPTERVLYVQDLWDRIADQPQDLPITEAQRAELQDRLADYRAHPETSIPWEVARERMRMRMRRAR